MAEREGEADRCFAPRSERVALTLACGNGVRPDPLDSYILHDRRPHMKWILATACAAAISLTVAPAADAKGCIKGAIVGGVAGHMAGHGKLGAAAGCVVGHHEANKADANKANAQAPADQK